MYYIAHRINIIDELVNLPDNMPIEFDIRDSNGDLIVTHDPFTTGPILDYYLSHVGNRFCILNVKSEGIEWKILDLLKKHGIQNYFFLDCSVPMIHKLVRHGCSSIAVRYSEYESLESVLAWAGKVRWVWVDCFTAYPLTKETETLLHDAGFLLCLVSPELQGHTTLEETKEWLYTNEIKIDAICTKVYSIPIWSRQS